MLKYISSLFIIIFMLFLSFSCDKKQPTNINPTSNEPDTTSHEFEWQIDYFGDGASSYLRDVCIVDENDIWVVGQIFIKDSKGEYINPPYNLIHWDGQNWELKSVKFKYYYGWHYSNPKCIFSFNNDDFIISSGGSVIHWNGDSWKSLGQLFTLHSSLGDVSRVWGTSINDFYGVGSEGSILHYNGSTWQKLESGTTQPINDIWGLVDESTNQQRVFCVASDKYQGGEKKVYQIIDNQTVQEFDWTQQKSAYSVWFDNNTPLYVCGAGLHIYENEKWSEVTELPKIYKNRVRGNHRNDVFVVGDFGFFAHFNGKSWRSYLEDTGLTQGSYTGLAVKDDLVVAVGFEGRQAVILRGRRMK